VLTSQRSVPFGAIKAPPGSDADLAVSRARQALGLQTMDQLFSRGLYSDWWDSMSQYFPSRSTALHALSDIVVKFRASALQQPSDSSDDLTLPLTKEEARRARFAHTWKVPPAFESLGPRYGRGFSLYLYLLPGVRQAVFRHMMLDVLRITQFRSRSALDGALSALSDTAKKLGPLFSPHWMDYVNLGTLGGYRAVADIEDQVKEVTQWVTGDKLHLYPTSSGPSEVAFLKHFRAGVGHALDNLPSIDLANETALTIDQFASDPQNWGNTGATSSRSTILLATAEGPMRAARDKMTTAMLTAPETVSSILRSPYVFQSNKVIMKRETAKVRAVVNSDDTVYLKMHYVASWLERALRGNAASTLFMSESQRQRMWQNLAREVGVVGVRMPLDQSHFDWQQNRRMIRVVCEEIERVIAQRADPRVREDLLLVARSITFALTHGGVVRFSSRLAIPIEKGVMSGWRWTALIDTLMNIGELHAARTLVGDWVGHDPVLSFVAQGDDDEISCPSLGDAALLCEAYRVLNFEVNPGKFWISHDRDEFLRMVITPGQVRGYLSRALNNILWRPPVNADPPPGEISLRAQLAQWNLVCSRGAHPDRAWAQMLRDMVGRNAIPRRTILQYLFTPAPYGGAGVLIQGQTCFGNKAILQPQQEVGFRVVSQLPGVARVREWLTARGLPIRILHRSVNARIPRQGLRRRPSPPEVKVVSVRSARPPLPSIHGPPLPRVAKDVPEFLRTQLVAELAYADFDTLALYYEPASRGILEHWRKHLTRNAFRDLLGDQLPLQQPTVWGRGSEETSAVWTGIKHSILLEAYHRRKVSIGWFRSKATGAVDQVLAGLGVRAVYTG